MRPNDEADELGMLQDAGDVMLAVWRNACAFEHSEIAVLGVIQDHLWAEGCSRVQINRNDLMAEAGICRATAAIAVRRLVEKGVIEKHDMGHKKPLAYSINRCVLKKLAS